MINSQTKRIKMKAAVCLAIMCAFVALTQGEQCRLVGDCGHVSCPENDYDLECVQHQCTCTHVTANCTNKMDCASSDSNCRFGWHCVDNRCRCGFGFPINGGVGK